MSASALGSPDAPPTGSEQDRRPPFRAFLVLLTVLTMVATSLRFWSRSMGPRGQPGASITRFWWDDWFALLAVFSITTYFALGFVLVDLGFGLHVWMVQPANLPRIFKILYTIYFVYDLSLFLTKTSALLFLTRVFPSHATEKWWNYTLYATHGLNVAWLIGIVFGTMFMCSPVQKGWDPARHGTCGRTDSLFKGSAIPLGSAIPSVAIDFIILLLPVPKIWSLRMGRTQKVGITIVFVLGYGVVIVSLGRLITVLTAAEKLNQDVTYEGMPMVYWVTAEPPTLLISICLPPMVILFRKFYAKFLRPFSSKLSSLSGRLTVESLNGTFESHPDGAHDAKDMQIPLHDIESAQSFADTRRSLSTESRSDVIGSATIPGPRYTEFADTRLLQDRYIASVQSGQPKRCASRGNVPSGQIQVDQHISVKRQVRTC